MKIAHVDTFLVEAIRQNWLFVKITTDSGLCGWGEASLEGQEKSVLECIHKLAERSVIGENLFNIEKIWRKMYHHGFWKGGFIHMSAISGIDIALWDLLGKALKVPTHVLLGGAVRNKIRTYTHASDSEMARKSIEMGFDGVKTGGSEHGLEKKLDSIRRAVGPEKKIMIDNHGQLTTSQAIKQMEIAKKYDVHFYEEPIAPENSQEYKRIREASDGLPIAAGERKFSRYDFRELIEQQLVDFVQPDICHCGGISEIRRIASYAEVYHIQFAPHNPNGPISTAASIQVAAATQNFSILEFASLPVYQRQDIFNLNLKPTDGFFEIPQKPGLGIEIDEDLLAKYPYQDIQYDPRYLEDGTVAEI